MTDNKKLPNLSGQWIDLVPLKGPVQLPNRPKQMIDSYSTIWQVGDQLWAGDGFGNVTANGVVTMYGDTAQYENGEIVWPGDQGLNAYVRTFDLTGTWVDDTGKIHELTQKNSPVTNTQKEAVLGNNLVGSITGYQINFQNTKTKANLTAVLSGDCFTITWADGSTWNRHLHLGGEWVSIKNKCRIQISTQGLEVSISGIPGYIDLTNWYVHAKNAPFPDNNKTKGGIDYDSTAIHWSDYIGWQRAFNLTGAWLDQKGAVHGIANQSIQDPNELRRFIWSFDTNNGKSGTLIRNWIEIGDQDQRKCGQVNYANNRIHWQNGDVWQKQTL